MDQCRKWVCEPGVTGHTCLNRLPCPVHQQTFRILWPNVNGGRMTAERIGVLYSDAVANGDVTETGLTDPRLQAEALDDAGLITLGK